MPAGWVAGIGAVVGGVASAAGSASASNAQVGASKRAIKEQQRQYDQTRQDQTAFREAGQRSIGQLSDATAPGGEFNRNFTLADFQRDPGYQFRLDEGTRALESSAAARGDVLGGAQQKRLTRYGQDYASGEYSNAYNRFNNDISNRFNRLASVAGIGQTATQATGNAGAQSANSISDLLTGIGNSKAAGIVGGANAINGGISNLANYYQQQQLLSGLQAGQLSDSFAANNLIGTNNAIGSLPNANIPHTPLMGP